MSHMTADANRPEKMTRTSVTIPSSLKKKMDKVDVNWSALVREAIRQRLERGHESNISEALLLNERLRRKAPEGWDSAKVIRFWRSRRS
jgi:post-segregation antitoxin (ccd killing protein)